MGENDQRVNKTRTTIYGNYLCGSSQKEAPNYLLPCFTYLSSLNQNLLDHNIGDLISKNPEIKAVI
jgi:hypothetical protein